ncbi:MAG: ABC transporter ATP-binding protein [Candidatus Odinarchaeota archaeon]
MSNTETTVRVENLHKYYIIGDQTIKALNGINLAVKKGEYLVIMGPSGSGKTTLLNIVGALDVPNKGECYIDGIPLSSLTRKELSSIRVYKIGFVFQTFNLIDTLSALDNVSFPLVLAGKSHEEIKRRAKEVLEMVGLGDRTHHRPPELSGGQRQRVAIGRAIANEPSLILADEPTANLDLRTGIQIVNLLRMLNKETGVTVINTTHDLKLMDIADRISWLRDGEITRDQERIIVELTGEDVEIPYFVD